MTSPSATRGILTRPHGRFAQPLDGGYGGNMTQRLFRKALWNILQAALRPDKDDDNYPSSS